MDPPWTGIPQFDLDLPVPLGFQMAFDIIRGNERDHDIEGQVH